MIMDGNSSDMEQLQEGDDDDDDVEDEEWTPTAKIGENPDSSDDDEEENPDSSDDDESPEVPEGNKINGHNTEAVGKGSLQEEEPPEPQQETMQLVAAGIIQRAWRRYVITFPPRIYYKIFTYRPTTDLCPRDYSKLRNKKLVALQTSSSGSVTQEDRSGWYQRVENNTWRLFSSKTVGVDKNTKIGAHKTMDFHYSKLQRKKDKWKKRRKIEWLKKLYQQGRLEEQNSVQEVMNDMDEIDDDEILDREVEELLAWTDTLSFDN
ncbi:protein MFI [Acanthochromis polyacanthus]|uniref:protein MFI n=1 Tax=Acanthochromis polyacanthus TaxID=80966 RepID=UPI00223493F4|nr:protein MFI [Acanthochromis polyacanthus]